MDPNNPQTRPPILDGTNYSHWKSRVRQYIKSIDRRAWLSAEEGWSAPKEMDTQGDINLIPPHQWSHDQIEAATLDDRALNAIQSYVDMNMFKLVKNCSCARDAWDILQRHCEGDSSIKESRLRILTTKFENMKMQEDEDISMYTKRILDIPNECQDLGEPISNKVLVSKGLRTVYSRFDVKVTAVETSMPVASLEFMDLMNMFKQHEINQEEKGTFKKKTVVVLSAGATSSRRSLDINDEDDWEINPGDDVGMITRKFNKMVRAYKGNNSDRIKEIETPKADYQPARKKDVTSSKPVRKVFSNNEITRYDPTNIDKIQCRECKGFRHYANQCANTLRKRGKSYWVSWSDEEKELFQSDEHSTDDEDVSSDAITALWAATSKSLSDIEEEEDEAFNPASDRYEFDYYASWLCLTTYTGEKTSDDDCLVNWNKEDENDCSDDNTAWILELKRLYDELLAKWKKQSHELKAKVDENSKIKIDLAKLEGVVTRKEMELNKTTEKLDRAQRTIDRWMTSMNRYHD